MDANASTYGEAPVLRSAAASSVSLAGDVLKPIAEIMRSAICRMTRAAVGLSAAERLTSKSERRQRLEDVAPNAAAKRFDGLSEVFKCDRHEGPLRSGSALRSA
jgi:hypothetical protein